MPTEDDLRAALTSLERHAPAAARVLQGNASRSSSGLRSPLALRWIAGIAATAAVAGVVAAATLTSGTAKRIPNGAVASAAPITKNALQAKLLAAFSSAGDEIAVEHSTYTINGETPSTIQMWYYPVQPSVGQQVHIRTIDIAQGGKVHMDTEDSYLMPAHQTGLVRVKGEETYVSYTGKIWTREQDASINLQPPIGPTIVGDLPPLGKWTAHNTTLNGRAAIEYTMERSYSGGGSLTDTLWVDASTNLPLREMLNDDSPGMHTIGTSDYEYLRATPANLAQLTAPIPAGFKRVAPPQVITPKQVTISPSASPLAPTSSPLPGPTKLLSSNVTCVAQL